MNMEQKILNHISNLDSETSLPSHPADLINLALDDLEKCEKTPNVRINMSSWFLLYGKKGEMCAVCFAGSVMRETLKLSEVKPDHSYALAPSNFAGKSKTVSYLIALDRFRLGAVSCGLDDMGFEEIEKYDRRITPYSVNPEAFKKEMRQLAQDLSGEDFTKGETK